MSPHQLFQKYSTPLEIELREAIGKPTDILYNMLSYQLAWQDEQGEPAAPEDNEPRLHASLCLLTCETLSGQYQSALPAAAAVELIHHQALVHEDVQVAHPQRGHRSTLWWLWGPGQAINAGDGLHALGRLALIHLQEQGHPARKVVQALQLLDQACLRMCEGQHMDLVFQEKFDMTVAQYLEMASAKTGALMSCAAELGALVATDNPEVMQTFRQVGTDLGLAYQIRDDILGLWDSVGGGPGSDALLSKKKSLPIAHAMETAPTQKKRELASIYFKRVLEPSDVDQLRSILEETQATSYAKERGETCYHQAMERLGGLDLPPSALAAFDELGQYMALREE